MKEALISFNLATLKHSQGEEPLGGSKEMKPHEADAFGVLKS